MTVSEEVRERVSDLVDLQPTKNAELQDRWGLESGSAVHQYLESELAEYYYRDEDSRIRATPAAESLVGDGQTSVQVTSLQAASLEVLGGPTDEPQSVVATLHALQDRGHDTTVDDVRRALRALEDRGLVEVIQRTVPTFRLAEPREELSVDVPENGQSPGLNE